MPNSSKNHELHRNSFTTKLNRRQTARYNITLPCVSSAVCRARTTFSVIDRTTPVCVPPCGPLAVGRDVIDDVVTSRLRRKFRSSLSDESETFADAPSLSLYTCTATHATSCRRFIDSYGFLVYFYPFTYSLGLFYFNLFSIIIFNF